MVGGQGSSELQGRAGAWTELGSCRPVSSCAWATTRSHRTQGLPWLEVPPSVNLDGKRFSLCFHWPPAECCSSFCWEQRQQNPHGPSAPWPLNPEVRSYCITTFARILNPCHARPYLDTLVATLWCIKEVTDENRLWCSGSSAQRPVVAWTGRKPEAEGLYVYGQLSHSPGETNTASRSNTLQQTTQRREVGGQCKREGVHGHLWPIHADGWQPFAI